MLNQLGKFYHNLDANMTPGKSPTLKENKKTAQDITRNRIMEKKVSIASPIGAGLLAGGGDQSSSRLDLFS